MFESFNIPGLYIAVQVSKRKSMFCNKPLPFPLSVKLHKSISMMLWNACWSGKISLYPRGRGVKFLFNKNNELDLEPIFSDE